MHGLTRRLCIRVRRGALVMFATWIRSHNFDTETSSELTQSLARVRH
jgi:hypothetical protein